MGAAFVPARALMARALAALVLAAPAAAQTANPPPSFRAPRLPRN